MLSSKVIDSPRGDGNGGDGSCLTTARATPSSGGRFASTGRDAAALGPGDPFTSHVINVLHLLLPAGERWFVDVVNKAGRCRGRRAAAAPIKRFVQQESWHAWAHTVVLEHLPDRGIEHRALHRRLESMFGRILADHPGWPATAAAVVAHRRFAVVAAIEHYTCVLGRWASRPRSASAGADPVMLDLLRWHGAEEVEHRSLVFDVHDEVSGSHLQRATTMATTIPTLFGLWIAGANYLLQHDPALDGKQKFTVREYRRAAREGKLPSLRVIFGGVPSYLKPGYNPIQEFSTQQALDYLASSPAAQSAKAAAEDREDRQSADS